MVNNWYYELEHEFPDIKCNQMVDMPNHFHCIIENTPELAGIETDDDVKIVNNPETHRNGPNSHRRRHDTSTVRQPKLSENPPNQSQPYSPHNKKYNATIGAVINRFKTMPTNEFICGA